MTIRPDLPRRRQARSVTAMSFALGILACSSDGTGLKQPDGGAAGRTDAYALETGTGVDGVGGTAGRLDAGSVIGSGSHGGTLSLDASGKGGSGIDGATSTDAGGGGQAGGSTGAAYLDARAGTGGSAGGAIDATGTPVTGGTGGNVGDVVRRDDVSDAHPEIDIAQPTDAQTEEARGSRDSKEVAPDALALDGSADCGALNQPCCDGRTCDSASIVCTSGGSGSGGTCVACGGSGQPCCAGDTCTAAGVTCTGSGRGAGTCR
jgi:hypothetical protein